MWSFSFEVVYSQLYNFKTWSERKGIFTIGVPSPFLIYVQNIGNTADNYTITYDVDYNPSGDDLSHLIDIHLVSNRIENLEANRTRDTQGAITLLGPVFNPPNANITFNVTSENSGNLNQTSIEISGGASGGFLKTLPEFGLIGFLELFLLICLVIFYRPKIVF